MASNYNEEERRLLKELALRSIHQGSLKGKPLKINLNSFPTKFSDHRACFVTLMLKGQLRGCIGSIAAYQPLANDVVENAYSAAFKDPRFSTMTTMEAELLTVKLSVLTPPQKMSFKSEADLVSQIRPGIDGLILSDNGKSGTFLPSVWEQFPKPDQFLGHLKNKAGLSQNYWSGRLEVKRYTTEEF